MSNMELDYGNRESDHEFLQALEELFPDTYENPMELDHHIREFDRDDRQALEELFPADDTDQCHTGQKSNYGDVRHEASSDEFFPDYQACKNLNCLAAVHRDFPRGWLHGINNHRSRKKSKYAAARRDFPPGLFPDTNDHQSKSGAAREDEESDPQMDETLDSVDNQEKGHA